ncbi:MAG: ABC-F family ATP-binding cassette domain-containing protein [Candidatus Kapabacteria bacterium]|nr:ABC-F family ATP-binding cassette domain-containing protein [Candidatus Kapabacteria bacterium]
MLTISNLSIHFSNRYLFDDVTFTIGDTDRIGLIGKNGTGKSTLLKILCGDVQPENGKIIKSNDYTVGYLPQDGNLESELSVFAESKKALVEIIDLERKISKITADISERTDYQSAEYEKLLIDLHSATERFEILGGDSADAKVETILHGLGFTTSELTQKVNEFSGGWRMRIALAKVLLSNPDCILLDEPTNHLDIESIIWLENFLKNYRGAVMVVSHDRRFLDSVTNRTIEISAGNVVHFNIPYTAFMARRAELREQQLSAYRNQQKQIEATEKYIERFRYKSTLASRVQSKIKQLDKVERIEIEEEDNSAVRIKFPPAPHSGVIAVEVKNMTKYYGEKLILEDINLVIERGEKVAFVGKNGEGKTTLTRVIAHETDYEGTANLGHNISMGYFSQHQADLLNKELTVFQTIDNAAIGDMRTKVRSILGAFLFSGDSVDKKVKVLSGGERSRLAMAKLLLEPHNLLILDEPTNHLDISSKDILKDALNSYEGALIVVSHDRDFLQGLTQKTFHFGGHKVKEYLGGIDYFLEKQHIEYLNEVERKSKEEAQVKPVYDGKSAKESREEQKKIQREQNKIKKIIADIELHISNCETAIAEIEAKFTLPDIIAHPLKLKALQTEYDNEKRTLDNLMLRWEEANTELEKIV